MSRYIFIHDFYRDGYTDMLAEVRVLQACGQWTKQKRASAARHEVSTYHACKQKFPRMDTGYWAGRVAAIKSATTAHYPTRGKMIFCPLPDDAIAFCKSCGDCATWECGTFKGDDLMVLCDRCKQESVREQTAYSTPDGWDWSEHEEDQHLPVPVGDKLVVKDRQGSFFFPSVAFIGFGIFEVSLHLSLGVFLLELLLIVHFMTFRKEILQGFRKLLGAERQGVDQ